jgi:hypothetical protein
MNKESFMQGLQGLTPLALVAYVLVQPGVLYAGGPDLSYLTNTVGGIGGLVETAVPVLIALGLLGFIWGLVTFIFSSGNEDAKEEGKRKMIWGIITLFVIVSVWGLVGLLNQVSGVQQGTGFVIPDTNL